jgi:hypothetical protein
MSLYRDSRKTSAVFKIIWSQDLSLQELQELHRNAGKNIRDPIMKSSFRVRAVLQAMSEFETKTLLGALPSNER